MNRFHVGLLPALAATLLLGLALPARLLAAAVGEPAILAIEPVGREWVIRASVPSGAGVLVLEACRRDSFQGWVPRAVERPASGAREVVFRVSNTASFEFFRVRAEVADLLPSGFYTGTTNFALEPTTGLNLFRGGVVDDTAVPEAPGNGASGGRAVVESDVWALRGDTLLFFNQSRGLQVIDLAPATGPVLKRTYPLPGAGEQMYVLDDTHAVLLGHDPCNAWGTEARSVVRVLDYQSDPVKLLASLPLTGRIVESRLVGTALYVATETWQPVADGSGAWQSGTWVASFDLSDPAQPVTREPLWYPGSGNVVTATDRFLFVAVTDTSRNWPWRSDLHVVDITAADGVLARYASLPLAGRVADKFKIDLHGDVLRVVVESTASTQGNTWVTVLETHRLADPRAASPQPVTALDRLELAHGERLFGTRFDGQRAYVVTFLRIDPLWIVDLSNPSDLRISGELEIPGWSTYLHPMGDRLLTLGVDDSRGWRVAVQLFDVGDPARPRLLSKVALGENASWSEATSDEKALGVYPEAGLVLVPVSEWAENASRQGVQLVDLGRDTLVKRGMLESAEVVPRRAAVHRDQVVTVSSRQLMTADVTDRDRPVVRGSLELAYPVDRVLAAGEYRLEFSGSTLRVVPAVPAGANPLRNIDLGPLPVVGADLRGARLHLIGIKPAVVEWKASGVNGEWVSTTNTGAMVVSAWDLSGLPEVRKLGEASVETLEMAGADWTPLWSGDDLLVWASGAGGYRGYWGYPIWRGLAVDLVAEPGGRIAWPWLWPAGARELVAVRWGAEGQPAIASRVRLGGEGGASGAAAVAAGLVFSTRQIPESTVMGTNEVVELSWVPGGVILVTNRVVLPDGRVELKVEERIVNEWKTVTNRYPVLKYWNRYELDVVDYSQDGVEPVVRPAVASPGVLQGVLKRGGLLVTTARREGVKPETSATWLEASSYDGVVVRAVDSVMLADDAASEAFAVACSDPWVFAARGGWGADAVQRIEAMEVTDAGRWSVAGTVKVGGVPVDVRLLGEALVLRTGIGVELIRVSDPGAPQGVPVSGLPGCLAGDLWRAGGSLEEGVWLPMGEYGVFRLGP